VTITNTGALTTTGVISAKNGTVSLTTLSPDSASRVLTIGADITTTGGAISANAANPDNNASALIVNGVLSTLGGSGKGTLSIGGGIALNAAPVVGSGNITLQGNGLDLTL